MSRKKLFSKNGLKANSRFIRLTDKPGFFLHPHPEGFQVKEGTVGAAIWTRTKAKQALRYFRSEGITNLEAVLVKAVLQSE